MLVPENLSLFPAARGQKMSIVFRSENYGGPPVSGGPPELPELSTPEFAELQTPVGGRVVNDRTANSIFLSAECEVRSAEWSIDSGVQTQW
jgi:hypothetical protein